MPDEKVGAGDVPPAEAGDFVLEGFPACTDAACDAACPDIEGVPIMLPATGRSLDGEGAVREASTFGAQLHLADGRDKGGHTLPNGMNSAAKNTLWYVNFSFIDGVLYVPDG